jgi:uncharacterized membrane protein YdjX (TVP38/TMEM64 family)
MLAPDTRKIRRWAVLGAALLCLVAAWLVVARHFTLADAKRAAKALAAIAEARPVAVFVGALLAQALGMALSLPTKALLALLAGALLGPLAGGAATEVGVLAGTTALFFGSGRLFARDPRATSDGLVARLAERLRARPLLAIIGLRLVVAIPYGPITIACAAAGIDYRRFLLGSLLGDLPITALYAFAGGRLMALAGADEAISPSTCVALAAAGLAMLAAALFRPLGSRRAP